MKSKQLKFFLYKFYIYFLNCVILVVPLNNKNKYNSKINKIYILYNNEEVLTKDDELFIVDETVSLDPNIKVKDSYKVVEIKEMKKIIEWIQNYNTNTDWKRSNESMLNEWIIHNILYSLNISVQRTKNVDFNNADEKQYLLIKNINH